MPSRGPAIGQNCYVIPALSGVPSKGDKIRIGHLTPGPTSGWNCYVAPAFLGVRSKGDKIKTGCIGGKDKIVDMQSKKITPKNFHTNCVLTSKKTLKPPSRTNFFFKEKKGGGVPWHQISETPTRAHWVFANIFACVLVITGTRYQYKQTTRWKGFRVLRPTCQSARNVKL